MDWLQSYYDWIKAAHLVSVISWMAGMFYLPRLFVYHSEKGEVGSELDSTFIVMERKLLKVIMNPAMMASWVFGLILIALGGFDFSSLWSWIKLFSVVAMTVCHVWLSKCQKEFAAGKNNKTGRTYRIANEVPTVLMLIIIIMVVVRPI